MMLIDKDGVRSIVCDQNHQPLINLNWEKDIEHLFDRTGQIQYLSFSSDCFEGLISGVQANTELLDARYIVVYLVIGCQLKFPFIDLVPLSTYLSGLPYEPDIVLGISKYIDQPQGISIYLFFQV